MKLIAGFVCLFCFILVPIASAGEAREDVLLFDQFDRTEKDPEKEQVGNGWGTNSKSRAKGVKQVDLVDGAMKITRADVADHGVSVTHEAAFRDATIELRFKIGAKDDLGINIADMKEKSVHAGHICVARIRAKKLEMTDLKTGRMDLATRTRRLADEATAEDKKRIAATTRSRPLNLASDEWHDLKVSIVGEEMKVWIDGKMIGQFQSPGIGHATKSRLRLSVSKSAWVDDVKITRHR